MGAALQSISEFYAAITRRRGLPAAEAVRYAHRLMDTFPTVAPSETAVRTALGLASSGLSAYWDGLLVATAAETGCTAILTEDLHDGGFLAGVRIVDPFTEVGLSRTARVLLGAM